MIRTRQQFEERLAEPQPLMGETIEGVDLTGFVGEDLMLAETRWRNCKLVGATFKRSVFSEARLEGVDLSRAVLDGCACPELHVSADCVLTGVSLVGTLLTDAHLAGTNLTEARLTAAILARADLTGVRAEQIDLTGAQLAGCQLVDADLREA